MLEEKGLRDYIKIISDGAKVTEEYVARASLLLMM
jgi:methanogenic corrinoid protein MtbC1